MGKGIQGGERRKGQEDAKWRQGKDGKNAREARLPLLGLPLLRP